MPEYAQAHLEDSRQGRSDIKHKTNARFVRWTVYLWTEPRFSLRRDQERWWWWQRGGDVLLVHIVVRFLVY